MLAQLLDLGGALGYLSGLVQVPEYEGHGIPPAPQEVGGVVAAYQGDAGIGLDQRLTGDRRYRRAPVEGVYRYLPEGNDDLRVDVAYLSHEMTTAVRPFLLPRLPVGRGPAAYGVREEDVAHVDFGSPYQLDQYLARVPDPAGEGLVLFPAGVLADDHDAGVLAHGTPVDDPVPYLDQGGAEVAV